MEQNQRECDMDIQSVATETTDDKYLAVLNRIATALEKIAKVVDLIDDETGQLLVLARLDNQP